jgi:DNA-directed RNA polymerase subunit L
MQISVTFPSKTVAVVTLDSVTVAEVLRVYLYEQGVEFAAWKKEHYSKPVTMTIRHAGGVEKVVKAAVGAIQKDGEALVKGL